MENSIKNNQYNLSLFSLIFSNCIPLIGVIFLGWNIGDILFMFWFENIVIIIYQSIKIAKAKVNNNKISQIAAHPHTSKALLIIIFLMLYGFFTLIHGVLLLVLFGSAKIGIISLLISMASLFISHGVSYKQNYIAKEEYKKTSLFFLFIQPCKRIFITHFVVLFGGMVCLATGTKFFSLITLVILKTCFDVFFYVLTQSQISKLNHAKKINC